MPPAAPNGLRHAVMRVPTSFRPVRPCRVMAVLAGLGVTALLGGGPRVPVVAQETAVPPPARLGEIGPEIYYLEDEGGRLVPVPGFRYRDFVELFKMREGLPGGLQPPAAILERLAVRLDLRASAALPGETAPVTIECTVKQLRGGWVHVPIDLGGLIFSAAPEHVGPGRVVIDAEPRASPPTGTRAGPPAESRADGQPPMYRLWFDATVAPAAETRHTVVLTGRVAVERAPGAATVGLRLPAATSSLVRIQTDEPDPVVTVASPPAAPREILPTDAATPQTAPDKDGPQDGVEIAGLVGPVRLRVAARDAVAGAWATVPQSTVESLVRIDGRNALVEATIRLENLRPGTNRVRVALPPRTTLRRVGGNATLIARGGTTDAAMVDVAIDRDVEGRSTIEIECERPVDAGRSRPIELIGFAVTGVPPWRQWGRVSVLLEGDWRAEWPDVPGIRRVDPPPAVRRPGLVASFTYDSQPASLPLTVQPRPSRLVVEPDYRYHVSATRLGLVARARISARGAPLTEFIVQLPGIDGDLESAWAVEEVGPPTLVDSSSVSTDGDRLTIPLLQSFAGDATIEVRASRRLARDVTDLEWSLPVPRADLVVPAGVSITSDSDIEVLFDAARSRGLVRQVSAGLPRSEGEGDATALLYRLDAASGRFVGSRRFLPRRTDATIATRADVDESDVVVEQTIRLDVVHVPLDCVELVVAEEIVAGGTLEVRQKDVQLEPLDTRLPAEPAGGVLRGGETDGVAGAAVPPVAGRPVDPAADAPATDRGPTGTFRVLRVYPPEPIIGSGEIVVRYRLPTPAINPESTETMRLPLILPGDARIDRQTLVIEAAEALAVDVPDESWRRDVVPDERVRAWVASRRQQTARLAIATRPRVSTGGIIVEAAWLRTELLPDRREDVFSYVLGGAGERTTVSLPGTGDDGEDRTCAVRLDGATLPVLATADGGFAVEVPRGAQAQRRLLEIRVAAPRAVAGWDRWATRLRLPSRIRLEPPVFAARVAERRFYWEITAREDDHLLGRPARWTSQQRWSWGRLGFASTPVVSSAAIGEWLARKIDASSADPQAASALPQLVERRVVYSGIGPPGGAAPWLVPTWTLVLLASGTTLLIGLAIAYLPWARRPGVLVPLVAGGVLATAAFPALAPLLVQSALPGAALATLAGVLRFILEPATTGRAPQQPAAVISASSLTRAVEMPESLVVARSSVQRTRSREISSPADELDEPATTASRSRP